MGDTSAYHNCERFANHFPELNLRIDYDSLRVITEENEEVFDGTMKQADIELLAELLGVDEETISNRMDNI